MKLTRISFFVVLFSLASVSFFPANSQAHEVTVNYSTENYSIELTRLPARDALLEKDPECPPLNNPNLDSQDGFDESLHKRKIKQIQRRKVSAEESIPTQLPNL